VREARAIPRSKPGVKKVGADFVFVLERGSPRSSHYSFSVGAIGSSQVRKPDAAVSTGLNYQRAVEAGWRGYFTTSKT
jgi:hypothetical protein